MTLADRVTFRLVASDLDGTLVRSDRTISARTVSALRRMTADGAAVALVTGRPIRWMPEVYAQLPVPVIAICANGAAVHDPADDRLVWERSLTPDLLSEATTRLREAVPGVAFAVERAGGRYLRHEAEYPIGGWEADHPAVRPADPVELVSEPAAKLLVRADLTRNPGRDAGRAAADAFTRAVSECLAGLAEATHSSDSGMVEVSAPGVTKGSGLAWLAGQMGVPAEQVIVFGDMPNDLPMFAWAGRAVAMGNAHPAVRNAADRVTGSHDDDGVAAYLDQLLDAASVDPVG
ncbi:MAG TPA: HAD family hydrolase [Micromonosporaceae bacterium]|nr:HAD family hydrolase [Micromonosporaceae bacterium]